MDVYSIEPVSTDGLNFLQMLSMAHYYRSTYQTVLLRQAN